MISRRTLMATGAGAAALASCPAIAGADAGGLVVVDPALLAEAPPTVALAACGPDLLHALIDRIGERGRMVAIVNAGDATMLVEMLRFRPRLALRIAPVSAGATTTLGRLAHPAQQVIAAWG